MIEKNEYPLWTDHIGFTFEQCKRQILIDALKHYDGNRTKTSLALDISIRTVRNWIKKFNLPAAR